MALIEMPTEKRGAKVLLPPEISSRYKIILSGDNLEGKERGHPVRLSAQREQPPKKLVQQSLRGLRPPADRMSALRFGVGYGINPSSFPSCRWFPCSWLI